MQQYSKVVLIILLPSLTEMLGPEMWFTLIETEPEIHRNCLAEVLLTNAKTNWKFRCKRKRDSKNLKWWRQKNWNQKCKWIENALKSCHWYNLQNTDLLTWWATAGWHYLSAVSHGAASLSTAVITWKLILKQKTLSNLKQKWNWNYILKTEVEIEVCHLFTSWCSIYI